MEYKYPILQHFKLQLRGNTIHTLTHTHTHARTRDRYDSTLNTAKCVFRNITNIKTSHTLKENINNRFILTISSSVVYKDSSYFANHI
jgi:hypothetical protein